MDARTRRSGSAASTDPQLQDFLFEKRSKIYPRQVHGLFASLRISAATALLTVFYGTPWLTWNAQQAVLFDLPARQFTIFGLTFWPQDFIYLTALLIIAAVSLFFFTAVLGRVWCGYACPQTVWTESFLWIERLIEGSRARQMRLDKAPWSARKIAIKASKHAIWLLFALFTGFTFVGYFSPIRDLAGELLAFNVGAWELFWILFYGLATYGNAGWLREQVCIYMCPYARFQSAMFDKNTLIVSYDDGRGEPRGGRKRGTELTENKLGHCIDCSLCVQVCPTGIDIRDGLQYQCIGCASCVDVCDEVMEKMSYPKGLVRYTTENALADQPTRIVRPRVLIYALILFALLAALAYAIAGRTPLELDVLRDRNALYSEVDGGLISNVYQLKILNKDQRSHQYRLTVRGVEYVELTMRQKILEAGPGQVLDVIAELIVDPKNLAAASSTLHFVLEAVDDPDLHVEQDARFLRPLAR